MTDWECKKYVTLCYAHALIDECIAPPTEFLIDDLSDDYPFMEKVERQLRIQHIGNFRANVAKLNPEAIKFLAFSF